MGVGLGDVPLVHGQARESCCSLMRAILFLEKSTANLHLHPGFQSSAHLFCPYLPSLACAACLEWLPLCAKRAFALPHVPTATEVLAWVNAIEIK